MNKRFSLRVVSAVLAVIILACSLPLALIALADESEPENVFAAHVSSIKGVIMDHNSHAVADHNQFNNSGRVFDILFDGDKSVSADVYGANDWNKYSGALITLDDTYYCGSLKLYSGYSAYPDTYDVYASDNISDLYSSEKKVGNIVCDGSEKTVSLNRDVKYVALFLTDYIGNGRIFEVELWTATKGEQTFTPENILKTAVSEANGILFNTDTRSMTVNSKFDENGAIAGATDGDTEKHYDVYGWSDTVKVGVLYTLDDTYFVGKASVYSGLRNYPDYWLIYASDNLDNLFADESLYANNLKCENEVIEPEINAKVKYIAFIFNSNGGRVKELQLWTAEDNSEKPFVPENVLRTSLDSSKSVLMNVKTGSVTDSTRFSKEALEKSVDGDTDTHTDVYGALDWEQPRYVGAVYNLIAPVYVSHAMIFSGFDSMKDTYRVYASDSLSTLFSASNIVGDNVVCGDDGVKVEINKTVRYIAFFCTEYNGNQRIKEFELWSAKDPGGDIPEPPEDKSVKVLTIGNSFAENASVFATEIAAAQGYNLTFGYIKYPSCTIAQHCENAVKNNAVYKFAYTQYLGAVSSQVVKDGSTSFATVKEALEFMNWDIVVIQQGSTESYNYASYEKAGDLIAYVKNILPAAEIMVHETWSWATWAADGNKNNNFKYIEDCYHQLAADNGNLKIIPSGRAFEFARKAGIGVNDSDNQHANSYGQYLAGACYVAEIFGADILKNTFGNGHAYFADVDMDTLRKAVMDAVNFDYDPATNWDWTTEPDTPSVSDKNFIARHLEASSGIMQDVANGTVSDGNRFGEPVPSAASLAIDGDTEKFFEVYGALDWEYPKNVGVMYRLDNIYNIDTAVIYAGTRDNPIKIDVYASDSAAKLYLNKIAESTVCSGGKVSVPVNCKARYIAFIVTEYIMGSSIQIAEFDLTGSDDPISVEKIEWPASPKTDNILKNAKATEIIAPGGDYPGTKEYDYRFMDQNTETDLSKLVDGVYDKHYDIWGLSETDKPGVLYELDGYYDLTHIHAFAGAAGSEFIVNNGFKVYASENRSNLFKTSSLVFSYQNNNDTTNEIGLNTNLKRVKYIAFILTNSLDGGWRMREFEAFGKKSADQSEAVEEKSIIEGIDAEYYGVATDNLADPIYMGASNFVFALTDGSRDGIEFWGGSDIKNSKFVFIYNLYENYDLTGIDIYAAADSIEEDSGIHKGIKSAKVYAARKFDDLFNSKPLVLKEDYTDASVPDENAYYSSDALNEWKGVRYIAYVFTIGDSRYGACRLEELKAFGTSSAVQDKEEEEQALPQYIDIKADNGVVARIFALNGSDDLTKLGAALKAETDTSPDSLDFVNKALSDYSAESIYKIDIVNASGSGINLGGRLVRLSIPISDNSLTLACVDDYGAEIVSTGLLNGAVTVETETMRSYALVKKTGATSAASGLGTGSILWIAAIITGILSLGAIAASVFTGIKTFKK